MIVALPAGGGVDALARILVEHMRQTLGQPIVVENMGGAGGTLVDRARRALRPRWLHHRHGHAQPVCGRDRGLFPAVRHPAELAPVALLPNVPYWMTARKTLPPNTLQELVAYLKANPDKLSATSVGTASVARFCGMFFQKQTATSFQFVPYRGGAPALQDLVAGNVDLYCDLASNSLSSSRTATSRPMR